MPADGFSTLEEILRSEAGWIKMIFTMKYDGGEMTFAHEEGRLVLKGVGVLKTI